MRGWMASGLLLATGAIGVMSCTQSSQSPPPSPPPRPPDYRLTGVVRASCYQAAPTVPQGSCTLHGQIQNVGGPGDGGIGRLVLSYRPAGSDEVITATCEESFPPLDPKDVAEFDCFVIADPAIYSGRILGTDLLFRPPDTSSPDR